jgi:mycothiol synthase
VTGDLTVGPWQVGVTSAQRSALRALLAEVRQADRRGPGPDGGPGADDAVLPAVLDDVLVGVAWRHGDDPAELFVTPARRGRGVGRRLADAALGSGGVWAHGTLPAARAIAEFLGARPVRTLLQLRRDLAGPFVPELPDGVAIRTFEPGRDEQAFLAVNGRAFAWHPEQGRLDAAGFAAEQAEPWFDPAGFFLAVPEIDPGRVLGFHWTKVHADDPTPPADAGPGPVGEVYVLAVDPSSPLRGLGTPLTLAGLAHLAGRGLDTVLLYVESDNDPALRLYRRLGFSDYAADTVFARD